MKKMIAVLVVALMLVAGFAGCGTPAAETAAEEAPAAETQAAEEPAAEEPAPEEAAPSEEAASAEEAAAPADLGVPDGTGKKVGVLYCLLAAPAVKVYAKGIQEMAEQSGAEIIELDGEWDPQKQSDQMSSLISQGVDAIVLNPVDGKSIIPVVKKAYEAGIPVVMGAMDIDESGREYVASFVGPDDLSVGESAGEIMMKALPDGGKVAIVEGTAGTSPQINRTGGFENAVAGSNIEIVAKLPADYDKAKAMAVAEDLLTKYPDLAGIWVHDDPMAVGVVQAMKAQGLTGADVKVVSYGGSKEGADLVKAGDTVATAVQPLVEEGRKSLAVALMVTNGQEVEAWYKDTIVPLTAENVDGYDPSLLW